MNYLQLLTQLKFVRIDAIYAFVQWFMILQPSLIHYKNKTNWNIVHNTAPAVCSAEWILFSETDIYKYEHLNPSSKTPQQHSHTVETSL